MARPLLAGATGPLHRTLTEGFTQPSSRQHKVSASATSAVAARPATKTRKGDDGRGGQWSDYYQNTVSPRMPQDIEAVYVDDPEIVEADDMSNMNFEQFVQYTKATDQLSKLNSLTSKLTRMNNQYSGVQQHQLPSTNSRSPTRSAGAGSSTQLLEVEVDRDARKAQRAAKRAERRTVPGGPDETRSSTAARKPGLSTPARTVENVRTATQTAEPSTAQPETASEPSLPTSNRLAQDSSRTDSTTTNPTIQPAQPSASKRLSSISSQPLSYPVSTITETDTSDSEATTSHTPISPTARTVSAPLPPPLAITPIGLPSPIAPIGLPPPIAPIGLPPALGLPTAAASAKAAHAARSSRYTRATETSTEDTNKVPKARAKKGDRDGTTQFLKSMGNSELLTPEEEKEYTLIVKQHMNYQAVATQLKGILKRTPTSAEWAAALQMNQKDFDTAMKLGEFAKRRMVDCNMRLVVSICKKYQNKGVPLQDLITVGINGLLRGVEKFEPSKGFRFSTYAHWWIRQAVTRSLTDESRIVRLPVHMYELIAKVRKEERELARQLGREPTVKELATQVKMPVKRLQELLKSNTTASSLDQPVMDDDNASTAKDLIEDDRMTADESFAIESVKTELLGIIDTLGEREALVLKMRFGLDGLEEHTLEDIGKTFKVTRERIRQIESKALRKLRGYSDELNRVLLEFEMANGGGNKVQGRISRGTQKT